MKPTYLNAVRSIFGLLLLLILSACGSELTGIDAPESVEEGVPFQVSVTHQFLSDDENTISPADTPDGALVFGVFTPPGYTATPTANYLGTWDGADVDLELTLQPGIPATNFIELLTETPNPPDEFIQYMQESDCEAFFELIGDEADDFQFHFFQTTADLYTGPKPLPDDGGEFTFGLTPGGPNGPDQVVVIHGLLIGGPGEEGGEDILGCQWYPDLEGIEDRFVPDFELAELVRFDSESLPVPVMGGAMIAVLALMLALAGIYAGRRRPQQ